MGAERADILSAKCFEWLAFDCSKYTRNGDADSFEHHAERFN